MTSTPQKIMMIRVNDIICGNGKTYRKTPGNEMYHILVRTFVDEYARQASRIGKTLITKSIVEAIRMAQPPGRFLKKEKDGFFYEIGDSKAWVKTAQLLRDIVLANKRKKVNKKPLEHLAVINSKTSAPTTTARQEYVSLMTSPPAPAPVLSPVAFNVWYHDHRSSSTLHCLASSVSCHHYLSNGISSLDGPTRKPIILEDSFQHEDTTRMMNRNAAFLTYASSNSCDQQAGDSDHHLSCAGTNQPHHVRTTSKHPHPHDTSRFTSSQGQNQMHLSTSRCHQHLSPPVATHYFGQCCHHD